MDTLRDARRVETFTLDNGLQVITMPAPGTTRVTAMVWYKVGSADDPAGKSGLAHLLEHVTFRGVEAQVQQHTSQRAERNIPEADAFTAHDYTAYYHIVPVARLDTVLQTEACRMANLIFTSDTLLLEWNEILAERRQEITTVPEARFDEQMRLLLYDKHLYGVPILGWPDEVQKLSAQDVNTFYQAWYGPNNAILIITGDTTVARPGQYCERSVPLLACSCPQQLVMRQELKVDELRSRECGLPKTATAFLRKIISSSSNEWHCLLT
jgi:zinc protease